MAGNNKQAKRYTFKRNITGHPEANYIAYDRIPYKNKGWLLVTTMRGEAINGGQLVSGVLVRKTDIVGGQPPAEGEKLQRLIIMVNRSALGFTEPKDGRHRVYMREDDEQQTLVASAREGAVFREWRAWRRQNGEWIAAGDLLGDPSNAQTYVKVNGPTWVVAFFDQV